MGEGDGQQPAASWDLGEIPAGILSQIVGLCSPEYRAVLAQVHPLLRDAVKQLDGGSVSRKPTRIVVKREDFCKSECLLVLARRQGCPMDGRVCAGCARVGGLSILQLARQWGCPWDARTCHSAAEAGDLEALKWARYMGCPWDRATACRRAASGGHLDALRWAYYQGQQQHFPARLVSEEENALVQEAAAGGHIEILRWVQARGLCLWQELSGAYAPAAAGGHLNILRWLRHEKCCPWPSDGKPYVTAASGNPLACMSRIKCRFETEAEACRAATEYPGSTFLAS